LNGDVGALLAAQVERKEWEKALGEAHMQRLALKAEFERSRAALAAIEGLEKMSALCPQFKPAR
jgi:hypothetical protein